MFCRPHCSTHWRVTRVRWKYVVEHPRSSQEVPQRVGCWLSWPHSSVACRPVVFITDLLRKRKLKCSFCWKPAGKLHGACRFPTSRAVRCDVALTGPSLPARHPERLMSKCSTALEPYVTTHGPDNPRRKPGEGHGERPENPVSLTLVEPVESVRTSVVPCSETEGNLTKSWGHHGPDPALYSPWA